MAEASALPGKRSCGDLVAGKTSAMLLETSDMAFVVSLLVDVSKILPALLVTPRFRRLAFLGHCSLLSFVGVAAEI